MKYPDLRGTTFILRLQLTKQEEVAWVARMKADVESYPTRFKRLLISGAELAPTTGMRHIHVYVQFECQRKARQLWPLLHLTGIPQPWMQKKSATEYEAIRRDYLKVDTKEDINVLCQLEWPKPVIPMLFEDDDSPTEPNAKRPKTTGYELRQIIESGDLQAVKDTNYMLYLRHKGAIEAECAKFRPKTDDQVYEHLWIHGQPGTGKTAYIKTMWPNAYWKDLNNSNFEEYSGQTTVVLDDMDNKRLRLMTVGKLKNLCNPAGDRCKVNYGTVHVKAQMIVTSNYKIKDAFKHKGKKIPVNPDWVSDECPIEEDVDYIAIKRRFREVSIEQLLFQANLQLKSKADIRALTPEQQANYEVFEPYDPQHNRQVDCYSECNQSLRTIGTQTDDTMSNYSTQTIPKDSGLCTDKNCPIPGMWIPSSDGKPDRHIHRKR